MLAHLLIRHWSYSSSYGFHYKNLSGILAGSHRKSCHSKSRQGDPRPAQIAAHTTYGSIHFRMRLIRTNQAYVLSMWQNG